MSVHGPLMCHGHKSKSLRFDGHKAAVVDTATQLITAVDVLPGNALDNLGALELVEQSEASAGVPVVESIGDRQHPSCLCRRRAQGGGASAGTAHPQALPQGRLRHRSDGGKLHLSGGAGHRCHRPSRETNRLIVVKHELPMNSAIPSEVSTRASWPALRNGCCANQLGSHRPA